MNPPDEGRPDPDALLAALEPEDHRGRLKIFLGSAPGVGKTYEMLVQASRRLAEGTDVVAGIIETHGRAETGAQIAGLPVLPRKTIPYRGRDLEEFDLDAALARHPTLLLVDELAHTNVPGSRHAKRWEDVADILAAGVNVWATLNVQHLESLNDDIARITGVRPTETLPDRVLDLADEIEVIDLSPADLRRRLQEGKIYRPDNATRALDGFFREGNLTALREIALRRAAAHVDTHMRDWMRRTGVRGPWPASDNLVALVAGDGSAEAVIRRAKRLADALHAPWTAVHIERATDGDAAARAVRRPLALAAQLGADIEVRPAEGADLVTALLDAARARNANHLVIGRGNTTPWRRLTGRTLGMQLLQRAPDFVLHVVPLPSATARPPPRKHSAPAAWLQWTAPLVLIAAVTAAGLALPRILPVEAANMIYLAVVVATAALWGTGPALMAAAVGLFTWDFFFIPPVYTVTIERPADLVTAAVFAAVAVLTGSLAGRARAEARAAGTRVASLRRITNFSRKLNTPATEPDLLAEIARQAAELAGRALVLTGEDSDLMISAAEPATETLDEGAWAAARWAFSHGEPTGHGTSTLPSTAWRFTPLQTVRGRLGVLGIRREADLDSGELQAMEALVDQSAVALERVLLAAAAARAAASEDTQRLRTALLASLGHDLRTPLAGIQGAAGTLRTAWDNLTTETRVDLLASIEQDVSRMARFLANITDLTRLESGQIRPRLAAVPVAEVVEAAISRLADPLHVATFVPASIIVRADASLLEQVLFNVLDNAVKYSPHGAFVRVRAEAGGDDIRIAVTDEGVGIPPEDLPHVFDSFFRVARGDRTAPGTGLGLAIARGLVEAMGGRIEAQSPSPDAPRIGFPGSVITIRLPAAAI
jgi:two-component system, OmpR family, sensor histidine kinase KdpD